jgi:hypothetical protein
MALPFVGHAIEEHWAGLRSAGLRMLACREVPLAGEHEPEATFRRRWGNPPVLVVVHARRPEK